MSREYKLHLRVQFEDAVANTCLTEPTSMQVIASYTTHPLLLKSTRHFLALSSHIWQLLSELRKKKRNLQFWAPTLQHFDLVLTDTVSDDGVDGVRIRL